MSIAVSNTYKGFRQRQTGEFLREAVLAATGLTAGSANTVPHGLPATPVQAVYVPTNGNGNWYETSDPDATNVYITSGSSGPTAFKIYVKY
jgi:hypothetical protein